MSLIADIIDQHRISKGQCLYVKPYMDARKITTFLKCINRDLEINLGISDVLLFFAEKSSGSKGIAVTEDHLVVSMGMAGIFNLISIESATISGIVNRKIILGLQGGQVISFVLTRGNKDARTLFEILAQYINQA